jgi:hypothetical protein
VLSGSSHLGVPLDAGLFSDADRRLEVVVDGEVLIPRQIVGSVPWALVAERVAPQGKAGQLQSVSEIDGRWALQDSNLGPSGYERDPKIGERKKPR